MPLSISQRREWMSKHITSLVSHYFGKFAGYSFTPLLQRFINTCYVKLLGLDMREFGEPGEYKTLNALFTRALKTERSLPEEEKILLSGVDALITEAGKIVKGKAYQIKGMAYDLQTLLGSYHTAAAEWLEGGEYINFYLSPKDYHRYHMPLDLKVHALTHIPGKLYPVNFPFLRRKEALFTENERVVLECGDREGRMHVLVLVGALNVGKMVLTFEERVKTNSSITEPVHYSYEELWIPKGRLFGWFEMGSTVLTFSQKGSIVSEVAVNQKVSFGEAIGQII